MPETSDAVRSGSGSGAAGGPGPLDHRARIEQLCARVPAPDPYSRRLSEVRQRTQARPAGSLGRLDELTHQIAAVRRTHASGPLPAVVSVLAADHGVAARGVSAHPHGLTGRVLRLVNAGQAPVNRIAARIPARVETADFGLLDAVGDQRYKVAAGTADIGVADAMSPDEAHRAVLAGATYCERRLADAAMIGVGEIGVGNTTVAAALAARLLGVPSAGLVGAGSGVDEPTVRYKRELVDQALFRVRGVPDDPLRLLAALGGLEIAGNVGVVIAAASRHQVVVIDGTITAVAALLAVRICPTAAGSIVAAHLSTEPAHAPLLAALGQKPLLGLDMRLGMASGAAFALGLINSMLAVAGLTPPAKAVGLAEPS
ncbi:nicotinate-nucleotide--dimethylbenzimidazole phosphoribosyltransferase [Sphaerisporangium rhizosphaerae]|uniref:Nicotinate-nucleotide--dimethylbenzimidazole phosphoribosyltransferase n=1 Tax=Sphaerisporangium rhizosphaerae TaxID=2269375 RepID=A0ABW2PC05_9ACTN